MLEADPSAHGHRAQAQVQRRVHLPHAALVFCCVMTSVKMAAFQYFVALVLRRSSSAIKVQVFQGVARCTRGGAAAVEYVHVPALSTGARTSYAPGRSRAASVWKRHDPIMPKAPAPADLASSALLEASINSPPPETMYESTKTPNLKVRSNFAIARSSLALGA